MAQQLTDQQELFARALFAGKNQTEAYQEAYPKSRLWKVGVLYSKASILAKHEKVLARLATLRAPVARRLQYDAQTAMDEAMQAFELAIEVRAPGAMVAAAQLRAKLQGLLVERKEVQVTQMAGMTPTDKQTLLDAANAALAQIKQVRLLDQSVDDAEPKGG